MAKLIKITGFLVGHDNTDEKELALAAKEILGSKFDCEKEPFKTDSVSIGPDDIFCDERYRDDPLNSIFTTFEYCEDRFRKTKATTCEPDCSKCIHREVCFTKETCYDIETQLKEFGCKDFLPYY